MLSPVITRSDVKWIQIRCLYRDLLWLVYKTQGWYSRLTRVLYDCLLGKYYNLKPYAWPEYHVLLSLSSLLSFFPFFMCCRLTRSWPLAPLAHPPVGWVGCARPACSSDACSCWPTAAAASGSRCWWTTGHSESYLASPPCAGEKIKREGRVS